MTKTSAVILAGGKNRRLSGTDKALLYYRGKTFIDHILGELTGFPEILISTDRKNRYPGFAIDIIIDPKPDLGPISGLQSALSNARHDWVFIIACDMPLVTRGLIQKLTLNLINESNAVIPVTRDGRFHPLCAFYHKRTLPLVNSQIKKGNYRMMDLIALMKVKEMKLENLDFPDTILTNINTPEDYDSLIIQQKEPL